MRIRVFVPLICALLTCVSCKLKQDTKSELFHKTVFVAEGNTPIDMDVTELERYDRYSVVRLQCRSGKPTGAALTFGSVLCEMGRARGAAYLTNLREWDDGKGNRLYIIGFAHTNTVNPRVYFGLSGDIVADPVFLSVADWEPLRLK